MAYIGNLPATGQNNSFRLLDDITSYTLTFDGSSASIVNSSDKTIESANHRFVQGQRVVYAAGGGTPVANLTGGTAYFIIKQGGSHFQLATTATNASNGVAISISAAGSATGHTLIASFDAVNTRFMASHSGGTKVNITRSAQLNISINGVIQEPQETASPTAGFGRDSGSVIVFSTAPNAGDAFWGSLVADNVPTFDISDNDVDNFTGDDSTTDFTLSKTPPDPRNILVTLDGVTQHPSDNTTTRAYTVTENILSFTSAPNTSVSIQVRHIGFAGATSGSAGVSAFYGRTGSVVLKNTDTINVANIVDEGYLAVGSTASFGGNVSIGGTLTYDDVTYVEAVGLSTFHEGIRVIGVSTFTDSVQVGGHGALVGTPHKYYYGKGGTQAGGLSIHAMESSLELVSSEDSTHGGSILLRTVTDGVGLVYNSTTNALEFNLFTPSSDHFAIHGGGVNLSSIDTQLRIVKDAAVELSFNGNKKFETTGYGVTVVGAMQVSGITTFNDKIVIKQAASGKLGELISNAAGAIVIKSDPNNNADNSSIQFHVDGGEKVRINKDGEVGIGTNDPQTILHLHSSASPRIQITDNAMGAASGDGVILGLNGDDDFFINNRESSKGIKFFTGSDDQRMVITSGGQVGLGITNPEDYFSSYNRVVMGRTNDTGGMTIVSSSTSGGYISFAKGTSGNQAYRGLIAYQHNGDYMTFNTDSGERLRITGAGITVTGEVAASQDYPITRPTLNFNFTSQKKLDPRITYQRTGPASYYDEFGKVVLVGDNAPRFDHYPTTRECKGLLIEGQRTNLFLYGTTPGNDWTGAKNGTFEENTTETTAPDGTFTATKWTFTNNDPYLYQTTTLSANTTYTISIWVKAGTNMAGDALQSRIGAAPFASSDLTIPTDGSWKRITYTKTVGGSDETSANVGWEPQTLPGLGVPASGDVLYIWGAQLEVGGFVSSFIPTYGSTKTRGNDKVSIDGDEFTEFYNQLESTVVCEFDSSNWITYNNNSYERIWSISNGSESDVFEMFKQNSDNDNIRYRVRDGAANVLGAANISYGTNTTPKTAFALKLNDAAVAVDGTITGTTDTGIPMPTVDRLIIGNDDESNTNSLHGYIRKFIYYPVKLPDSQVDTLTS